MAAFNVMEPDARQWANDALDRAELIKTDVLVLGGGMAGLRAAVRARELGREVVLAYEGRGASPFIIGCNAPFAHADAADSQEQYAKDVVAGGYGLSDKLLVQALARHATTGVRELVAIGAPIARDGERFKQRQLSGNWYPRSVYHPDGLGAQALPTLAAHATRLGVKALAGHRALRLLPANSQVCGAILRDQRSGEWRVVTARAVVLALGGLGRLYDDSTYPGDVAAASYALGYEAGAALVDMEFVQFEPLCTFTPEALKGLELPTSMLVEGACLLNSEGERFMFRYNTAWGEGRVEKARLSLCIQQEIDEGRGIDGGILYDATRVPAAVVEGYARHCKRLRKAGIDPLKLRLPVRPAAHSQMGGLWIDKQAATSVPGLFAAGEAAGGLHGASRIAGNGGADALVFGDIAGASAAAMSSSPEADWRDAAQAAFEALGTVGSSRGTLDAEDAKSRIRRSVSTGAGLYRTAEGLCASLDELVLLAAEVEGNCRVDSDLSRMNAVAALDMARVGQAVVAAALARTESRGAHQRRDFPEADEAWQQHVVVRKNEQNAMAVSTSPIR